MIQCMAPDFVIPVLFSNLFGWNLGDVNRCFSRTLVTECSAIQVERTFDMVPVKQFNESAVLIDAVIIA